MVAQARHLHRLLPLFDPLLGRTSLVIEPYHRPARRLQIGADEPDAREQLPSLMLNLCYHSSCRRPTSCFVEKVLVSHDRFVTVTSIGSARLPSTLGNISPWIDNLQPAYTYKSLILNSTTLIFHRRYAYHLDYCLTDFMESDKSLISLGGSGNEHSEHR
jgi:hypothetical protein